MPRGRAGVCENDKMPEMGRVSGCVGKTIRDPIQSPTGGFASRVVAFAILASCRGVRSPGLLPRWCFVGWVVADPFLFARGQALAATTKLQITVRQISVRLSMGTFLLLSKG